MVTVVIMIIKAEGVYQFHGAVDDSATMDPDSAAKTKEKNNNYL